MIVVALCVVVSLAAPHGGYGGYGGYGGGNGGGVGNNYARHGGYGGFGGHGPHGGIGNFYGWMLKIVQSWTCGWDAWANHKQDKMALENTILFLINYSNRL